MLKHIPKKIIKPFYQKNKEAMSVSFAVLTKLSKGNPEMVKLVYNLCRTVGMHMQSENPQVIFVLSNLTLRYLH
jgi:hypothetical protein